MFGTQSATSCQRVRPHVLGSNGYFSAFNTAAVLISLIGANNKPKLGPCSTPIRPASKVFIWNIDRPQCDIQREMNLEPVSSKRFSKDVIKSFTGRSKRTYIRCVG